MCDRQEVRIAARYRQLLQNIIAQENAAVEITTETSSTTTPLTKKGNGKKKTSSKSKKPDKKTSLRVDELTKALDSISKRLPKILDLNNLGEVLRLHELAQEFDDISIQLCFLPRKKQHRSYELLADLHKFFSKIPSKFEMLNQYFSLQETEKFKLMFASLTTDISVDVCISIIFAAIRRQELNQEILDFIFDNSDSFRATIKNLHKMFPKTGDRAFSISLVVAHNNPKLFELLIKYGINLSGTGMIIDANNIAPLVECILSYSDNLEIIHILEAQGIDFFKPTTHRTFVLLHENIKTEDLQAEDLSNTTRSSKEFRLSSPHSPFLCAVLHGRIRSVTYLCKQLTPKQLTEILRDLLFVSQEWQLCTNQHDYISSPVISTLEQQGHLSSASQQINGPNFHLQFRQSDICSGIKQKNIKDMCDLLLGKLGNYHSVKEFIDNELELAGYAFNQREFASCRDNCNNLLLVLAMQRYDRSKHEEEGKRCREAERADEPEVDTSGLRRGSSSHWENFMSEASLSDQDGRGIENRSSRPDATGASLDGHDSVADAGRNHSIYNKTIMIKTLFLLGNMYSAEKKLSQAQRCYNDILSMSCCPLLGESLKSLDEVKVSRSKNAIIDGLKQKSIAPPSIKSMCRESRGAEDEEYDANKTSNKPTPS